LSKATSSTLILEIGQMTYSVYQHWDPLRVCAVGRSYPPEFYSFITNSRVRSVMERIAIETEEDYQKLIKLLESFGVEIVRPHINPDFDEYLLAGLYAKPLAMVPRDYTAMIGDKFYMPQPVPYARWRPIANWNSIKADTWPNNPISIEEFNAFPDDIKRNLDEKFNITVRSQAENWPYQTLSPLRDAVRAQGNKIIFNTGVNTAMTTRIGRDLYFGTETYTQDQIEVVERMTKLFPEYRCHVLNTGGHSDSAFCPVVPGLIVSLYDIPNYSTSFPDWEVVYLPGQSWSAVKPFLDLKEKNKGKWWVPGEEFNNDFTDFVEGWLTDWVGYVEETVFDVNMLVIDEKNVVCNNYNEKVFKAFEKYNVTPHIINFRHRYFWDGGLHCITSDLHREGTMKDYFPERG